MNTTKSLLKPLALLALALACAGAFAQEAVIRKNLAEKIPKLPKIDEVRPSQIPGLFEVRYGGTEILYTDAKGEHIVEGSLIEVKTLTNLTEARIAKLTAVDFADLPIKDAILIRQGAGTRKVAVFVDPNCGYCKRFERDLAAVKDVSVYAFIIPILGPDSTAKARDIWCAKDSGKTWRAWMLDGVAPAKAAEKCDTAALDRNLEFSRKHRINGTPAVLFEDGTRKAGAIPGEQVEQLLTAATKKS
jgi:thiol:disulfide interchange protein DsbC